MEPPLFEGEPGHCSLCGEAGHTHDDHWLFQHEPVRALREQRDAAVQELERRTDWHNTQMLDLQSDYDALALERDILKAELRQYEPSDGMIHKLLALNTAIAEAATMLCDGYNIDASADWKNFHERVQAWLALPVVVHARKSLVVKKEGE